VADRRLPVYCLHEGCEGKPAKMIISKPARPDRQYEDGLKIAPWTLPPERNEDGSVKLDRNGQVVMQQVEVHSRREFLNVLKKNGLTELETTGDHLVQGGTFKRDQAEKKRKKLDKEAYDMAKEYAELRQSPDRVKKILDKNKKKSAKLEKIA